MSPQSKAWTPKQLSASLEKIRTIALSLPEATEEVTWGDVNFRVRKKIFVFPGGGGNITVKAEPDELQPLLDDPRFSPAPYLARGGWVRMDLQGTAPSGVDWREVRELIETSYVLIAPKKLGAQVTADSRS